MVTTQKYFSSMYYTGKADFFSALKKKLPIKFRFFFFKMHSSYSCLFKSAITFEWILQFD